MTILKWNAVFITQVLVEWLMDQVPLGNKTPRPGLPRLVHCPACRGLLPYPQALDSGHVLLECFAIEGTNPELVSVFLKTIQVQEFEKESEPSLRTAEDWARAKRQPTPSLSRDWIQVEPRCQFETTWREEPHFLRWPTCGFILGARKRMSEFHVIPFLRDILRFYFPSPGPKMRLPIVFRPPHQQEISEENYQAKGGQEEKFDFCSGTFDTCNFNFQVTVTGSLNGKVLECWFLWLVVLISHNPSSTKP